MRNAGILPCVVPRVSGRVWFFRDSWRKGAKKLLKNQIEHTIPQTENKKCRYFQNHLKTETSGTVISMSGNKTRAATSLPTRHSRALCALGFRPHRRTKPSSLVIPAITHSRQLKPHHLLANNSSGPMRSTVALSISLPLCWLTTQARRAFSCRAIAASFAAAFESAPPPSFTSTSVSGLASKQAALFKPFGEKSPSRGPSRGPSQPRWKCGCSGYSKQNRVPSRSWLWSWGIAPFPVD